MLFIFRVIFCLTVNSLVDDIYHFAIIHLMSQFGQQHHTIDNNRNNTIRICELAVVISECVCHWAVPEPFVE